MIRSPTGRAIVKLRQELSRRLRGLVTRVTLDRVTDTDTLQGAQVIGLGDAPRTVEVLQPAGLSSYPSAGEGVALAVGGRADHSVVVGLHNRVHRPTARARGDTVVYAEGGAQVVLLGTGDVLVIPKAGGDVVLGETEAAEAAALAVAIASKVETELSVLKAAIGSAPIVAGDGGAAYKAGLVAALAAWPASTASPNVRVKI